MAILWMAFFFRLMILIMISFIPMNDFLQILLLQFLCYYNTPHIIAHYNTICKPYFNINSRKKNAPSLYFSCKLENKCYNIATPRKNYERGKYKKTPLQRHEYLSH